MVFSFNYLDCAPTLFLSTCPTQGMYPFIDICLSGIPFIYEGLSRIGNQEYLYWETQGSSLLGKIPRKTTTNTCCYSVTHKGVHSSCLTKWLLVFYSKILQNHSIMLQNFSSMVAQAPSSSFLLSACCSCQKH
jgi:hypothetical protein